MEGTTLVKRAKMKRFISVSFLASFLVLEAPKSPIL